MDVALDSLSRDDPFSMTTRAIRSGNSRKCFVGVDVNVGVDVGVAVGYWCWLYVVSYVSVDVGCSIIVRSVSADSILKKK